MEPERWAPIPGFPKYSVSDYGRIRRDSSGRILALSVNQFGVVTVGLMGPHSVQYHRSVPLLVANAFVDGKTRWFDTPICLDGDRMNNRAVNLAWRPRWFAKKYNRQFRYDGYEYPPLIDAPIKNLKTGELFTNSIEVAKWYGVLEEDLIKSMELRTYVWPTYDQFAPLVDLDIISS